MDRKIGKLLWFVVVVGSNLINAEPTLELSLTTLQGAPMQGKRLGAGVPYLLEIVGHDMASLPPIEIAGLNNWHYEPRGTYKTITTVNGRTQRSVQSTYYIRSDQPGEYVIGPARCMTSQGLVTSAELRVVVGSTGYATNSSDKTDPVFLELAVDEDEIFIGQPIKITVTLYCRADINLAECTAPSIASPLLEGHSFGQPIQGVRTIKNVSYHYGQWEISCIPQDVGSLTIPSATLSCLVYNSRSPQGIIGGALRHFGLGGTKQHQLASNAVRVSVQPLPPGPCAVDALGVFTDFKMHASHQKAKEGEGIILTLTLEGKGNPDQIKNLKLSMPDQLNFYPSKIVLDDNKEGCYKKSFEYVVQGSKPGTWTIPPQEFIFFDTFKKVYSSLVTDPLSIVIDPLYPSSQPPAVIPSLYTRMSDGDLGGKLALNSVGPWLKQPSPQLSWALFYCLFFLPLLLLMKNMAQRLYGYCYNFSWMRRKRAVSRAQRGLQRYLQTQDISILDETFKIFITDITQATQPVATINCMKKFGTRVGLNNQELDAWSTFVDEIAACRYASEDRSSDKYQSLFKCGHLWISKFQEIK